MAGETEKDGVTETPDAPGEFEKSFAEFASPGAPPADQAAEKLGDPDPEPNPEDAPSGPEAKGSDTDQAAASDTPPADKAPDDIWADAPQALRDAYEALRRDKDHTVASLKGRLSVLDRELAKTRSAPAKGDEKAGDAAEKPANPLESDEIKKLREEYPEIAGPLITIITAQQQALDKVTGTVSRTEEQQIEAYLGSQLQTFEQTHPDWRDFSNDDRFEGWLATQPRHVQEAAKRNEQHIVDAAEASDVLSRFKAAHGITAAAAPPEKREEADPKPDTKRQKQLDGARDATAKGPPAASGVPDEFEAAFKHYASQDSRQRQRA